jgi:hypothetical protein
MTGGEHLRDEPANENLNLFPEFGNGEVIFFIGFAIRWWWQFSHLCKAAFNSGSISSYRRILKKRKTLLPAESIRQHGRFRLNPAHRST